MVIDISIQVNENSSRSQMSGPWEQNLAFVISLSKTQTLLKHNFRIIFLKVQKMCMPKWFFYKVEVLYSAYSNQISDHGKTALRELYSKKWHDFQKR